jgi:hypothetical protein
VCTGVGFNGSSAACVHTDGVRQELSAQADIAQSEPRLHSPGLGRREYRLRSATGIIRSGNS